MGKPFTAETRRRRGAEKNLLASWLTVEGRGRFRAVAYIEFAVDVFGMPTGGSGGDVEPPGNFPVGETGRQQVENLLLSLAEAWGDGWLLG